jgi:hypothetical protein
MEDPMRVCVYRCRGLGSMGPPWPAQRLVSAASTSPSATTPGHCRTAGRDRRTAVTLPADAAERAALVIVRRDGGRGGALRVPEDRRDAAPWR